MDGERIAKLYAELGYPGAAKFQSALRKEGINVSLGNLKDLVKTLGSRQICRPPPEYEGHVTARRVDDKWVADLLSFESRPVDGFRTVLLVQDMFTRWLWAVPMKSKKETTAQFSRLMTTQERKCRQLTTDKGTEFTSVAFNQLMVASDIRHVYKEALNDLSTIDRAMGLIKDRIGVIVAERGGTWLDVLQQVINAHNGLDTKALLDNAPEDVFEDAELRFRLRQANAEHDART